MSEPTPAEIAVDAFVDRLMRGEAPPVDAYVSEHPELGPADIERLRKLARALGGDPSKTRLIQSEPPQQLGSYKLLERLGAGGMGIVYLAEDVRLARQVALKIIRPELAGSPDALARFEREARAVARLQHESIVRVFEAGREGGIAYLAMEFVRGESLDELFAQARREQRRVPVNDLVRWTRDIARALAAAHSLGIVHRDVKPSNVRITPDGRALLLDFGLAFDADSASISRTGQLHGTLFYVSPEQISGTRTRIDARTDVWSLGVTLYEGLTGRLPFGGEQSQEVLYRILSSEPIAPRVLAPDLSRDLETVVLAALEKDRERRYASASAFADDLDAILEHRPVHARPSGAVTRVWKWSRRKPAHAAVIALALLLAIGGPLVYAALQARHAKELDVEKELAVAQRKLAESRADDLERMTRFQGEMFDQVEPRAMAEHMLATLRDELRDGWKRESASANEIEARLKEFDALIAPADTTNVAVAALRIDVIEPAIQATKKQLAERPKVEGMALHTLATTCWSLGLGDLALSTQRTAYERLLSATSPDDEEALSAEANLGYYLLTVGSDEEAEPLLRHAADGLARVAGADDERSIAARNNLSSLLRLRGDYVEAERVLREVLAARRRVAGDDDPQTMLALSNLGALLVMRREGAAAEPLLREAYERRRRVLGPEDEATLTTAHNLGVLSHNLGHVDLAESVFREAHSAARSRFGDRHPLTAVLGVGLAESLADNGCREEAVTLMRRSIDVQSESAGPTNSETLYSVSALCERLREDGRWDEAEALIARFYGETCATIGETHRSARGLVSSWAKLLRDEGRFDEANELFRHLQLACADEFGPAHELAQRYAAEQVRTLTRARKHAEAETLLETTRAQLAEGKAPSKTLVEVANGLYSEWVDASPERNAARERWRELAR